MGRDLCMKKKIMFYLIIMLLVLSVNLQADAINIDQLDRRAEIEKIIIQAEDEAASIAKEQALLETKNIRIENLESTKFYQQAYNDNLNRILKGYDITPIENAHADDNGDSASIMNVGISSKHLEIKPPSMYSSSQGIIITARAKWINWGWLNYYGSGWITIGSWEDVGKGNAFGIHVENLGTRNMTISNHSFYTRDCYNKMYNNNLHPFEHRSNYVIWRAQDRGYVEKSIGMVTNYTWNEVVATSWVDSLPSGTDARITSTLVHTWGTTGLTISGSNSGFSVGFTEGTKGAQAQSNFLRIRN